MQEDDKLWPVPDRIGRQVQCGSEVSTSTSVDLRYRIAGIIRGGQFSREEEPLYCEGYSRVKLNRE